MFQKLRDYISCEDLKRKRKALKWILRYHKAKVFILKHVKPKKQKVRFTFETSI